MSGIACSSIFVRKVFIVTSRLGKSTWQIIGAHLAGPGNEYFQLTAYTDIDVGEPRAHMLALEPSGHTVVSKIRSFGIEISNWIHNRTCPINMPDVRAVPQTPLARQDVLKCDDQLSLLSVRLVGDHLLIFRTTEIELLPVPLQNGQPTPQNNSISYRLRLGSLDPWFTGASLSEPLQNPESPDGSRVVYVLARLVATGFFYLRVTIYNLEYTPSGPGARMEVHLLGVYEMGKPGVGRGEDIGPCMVSESWLGPEGKRGVWVESSANKRMNVVVAASFDQDCLAVVPVESGDDLRELSKIASRIESTGDVFIVDGDDCEWSFK